jgi:hypothetical protein
MRRIAVVCGIFALVACAKKETANTDTASTAAAAPPPPAAIALADVAGTWDVKVMPESGDSTLLTYELTATADPAGWSLKFPDRSERQPVRVTPDGDSLIIEAGPYPSALRKGTTVTTHGSLRLRDGKLVGSSVARYSVKTADSVRTVRLEGTKRP